MAITWGRWSNHGGYDTLPYRSARAAFRHHLRRPGSFHATGTGGHLTGDQFVHAVDQNMGCARHTRIKTPQRPQNINTFILFRIRELLQNGCIQHGLLIRPGCAPRRARRSVQGGGGQNLVVADGPVLNDQMMAEKTAARAPEANPNLGTGFGYFKRGVDFCFSLLKCLIDSLLNQC